MKHIPLVSLVLIVIAFCVVKSGSKNEDIAATIISMERAALDRWGNGDPSGFLEICAPEVTYFDTDTEHRLNGLEELKKLYLPLTGKIKVDRYEMIDPKVQVHSDVAVLTFNHISYGKSSATHWNTTEVYKRFKDGWKIIHTHWAHTQPHKK